MGKQLLYIRGINIVEHALNKKPILKQAKKDFEDILFLDFEQTKNKDIAKYLNINFWSTISVYKNNKQISKAIGLNNKDDIYSLIKEGI